MPSIATVKINPKSKLILPLTIGSDPELAICSKTNHRALEADTFLVDDHNRKYFGLDGNTSTAEIRPKPAHDPMEHIENIKKILHGYSKHPLYRKAYSQSFMASTPSLSIGGHIHIGHPKISTNNLMRNQSETKNLVCNKLIPTLDILLAVPVMFVENQAHARIRKQEVGYGHPRDFRWTEWGIEYRVLPSWLSNESLARAVVSLAYTISYDVLEKNYDAFFLYKNLNFNFNDKFISHDLQWFFPLLPDIRKEIKRLSLYKRYNNHIEYLLSNSEKKNCLLNTEIKTGWKIPYIKVRKVILYSLMTLTKKMVQTLPHAQEIIRTTLQIPFIRCSRDAGDRTRAIRDNINRTLNYLLDEKHIDQTIQYGRVYVERINPEYHQIVIKYNENYLQYKKIEKLARLIQDVCTSFGIKKTIHINVSEGFRSNHAAIIGLYIDYGSFYPDTYLLEIITFITLLYANNAIYKSYKISKKTGRKVTLRLLTKNIIRPFEPIAKPIRKKIKSIEEKIIPLNKKLESIRKELEDLRQTYNEFKAEGRLEEMKQTENMYNILMEQKMLIEKGIKNLSNSNTSPHGLTFPSGIYDLSENYILRDHIETLNHLNHYISTATTNRGTIIERSNS